MKNNKNNSNKPNVAPNPGVVRCAIYARCASDMSMPSSIREQIRRCRQYAKQNGWQVVDIRSDVAVSGTSLEGRVALQNLMQVVKERPKPFDHLLIDDTSRLARNLACTLDIVKHFESHGARTVAVSQGLDLSGNHILLTFFGIADEQYLASLREKIGRGQEGRVLSGYIAGGRCYGYKNVPVEDPTRKGNYGRQSVAGVRREIVAEQAEVVRRIFGMYANGLSLSKIAHSLTAEHVPAPHGHSNSRWRSSIISSILGNQHYRGVIMWNRTRRIRNPETGAYKTLVRPEAEWVQIKSPECRIISETIWEQMRAERQRRNRVRKYGHSRPVPDFQCSSVESISKTTKGGQNGKQPHKREQHKPRS
jgi:site-specific DNA recombinase